MNRLILPFIVIAASAPLASRAQIVNGDFEAGGTGWTASGHPDGVNPFLSTGGNPGAWGVVFCGAAAGKVSCLRQTFQCGEAGSGSSCQIRLDFLAQGFGTGANAAQVIVRLDDQVRFDQAVVGSASGWSTIEFSAGSGTHVLDLCLEVLESGGPADNPFWRGGFDNVIAVPTVGVEESPWGLVKMLYRSAR